MLARVNRQRKFRPGQVGSQVLIMELPRRRLGYLLAGGLLMVLTACRMTSSSPTSTPIPHGSTAQPATASAIAAATPAAHATVGATATGPAPAGSPSPTGSAALISEGQQIFQTGIGSDGQAIPRSATSIGGMMGGGMMGSAGCASCHGPQGQGERTPQFVAPNITYANLTDPHGMRESDEPWPNLHRCADSACGGVRHRRRRGNTRKHDASLAAD